MIEAPIDEQEVRRAVGVPGAGGRALDGVAPLDAGRDRCLYWCRGELDDAAVHRLGELEGCVLVVRTGSRLRDALPGWVVLEVPRPRTAVAEVLRFIEGAGRRRPWVERRAVAPGATISPHAVVDGAVEIGEGATVGPFCVVGPDVVIGPGASLEAGVRVHAHVRIGEGSTIGANVVIGQAGFGFEPDEDGMPVRVPQLGGVVIGAHVEVAPLSSIESGALTPTTIGDHVKLGIGSLVGHGARIADGARLTGGVGVGGSASIGEQAWIGMCATIRDGIRVGARVVVGMDVTVQADLPDGAVARAPAPQVVRRPVRRDQPGQQRH